MKHTAPNPIWLEYLNWFWWYHNVVFENTWVANLGTPYQTRVNYCIKKFPSSQERTPKVWRTPAPSAQFSIRKKSNKIVDHRQYHSVLLCCSRRTNCLEKHPKICALRAYFVPFFILWEIIIIMKFFNLAIISSAWAQRNITDVPAGQLARRYSDLLSIVYHYNPDFDERKYWAYGCNCLMLG